MQVHFPKRQLIAKVVYDGPVASGRGSSLAALHQVVPAESKTEPTTAGVDGGTLFFDCLLPPSVRVGPLRLRIMVYTIPGVCHFRSLQHVMLMGVDEVIFVADSQPEMMSSNQESLEDLVEILEQQGLAPATSLTFQWNKRDLPDALPVEQLEAQLNRWDAPSFESVAPGGQGVLTCFEQVVGRIRRKGWQEYFSGYDEKTGKLRISGN